MTREQVKEIPFTFVRRASGTVEGPDTNEFDRLRIVGAAQTAGLTESSGHPIHISLDGRVNRNGQNGNGSNVHAPAVEQTSGTLPVAVPAPAEASKA